MKTLITSLLATLVLTTLPALAGPDHSHGHSEVPIPKTLPELWAAIQTGQTALVAALEKKDGTASHTIADTLIAYVQALPEKAAVLEEAKRSRVSGQANNLARVYDEIHHDAESSAFDNALKNASKAAAVLKILETQLLPNDSIPRS